MNIKNIKNRVTMTKFKLLKNMFLISIHSLVNSVAWGPQELGLVLACGSSDGSVSILRFKGTYFLVPNAINFLISISISVNQGWERERFEAHTPGVTCLSWSPFLNNQERIVTGGCDNKVIIWK